jgi:hypothetical protein
MRLTDQTRFLLTSVNKGARDIPKSAIYQPQPYLVQK